MTRIKEDIKNDLQDNNLDGVYVLIVHNDDWNSFNHVIECLMKFCGHEHDQANQCAHLIHYKGKCDVKKGDQETIKTAYNQLKRAMLSVTMEKL